MWLNVETSVSLLNLSARPLGVTFCHTISGDTIFPFSGDRRYFFKTWRNGRIPGRRWGDPAVPQTLRMLLSNPQASHAASCSKSRLAARAARTVPVARSSPCAGAQRAPVHGPCSLSRTQGRALPLCCATLCPLPTTTLFFPLTVELVLG